MPPWLPPRVERPVRLVADRPGQVQLCGLRHGRVVLDRSYGCPPDALCDGEVDQVLRLRPIRNASWSSPA